MAKKKGKKTTAKGGKKGKGKKCPSCGKPMSQCKCKGY